MKMGENVAEKGISLFAVLLICLGLTITVPCNMAFAEEPPTGAEVIAYTVSPVDGVAINTIQPGKVFTLAVTISDSRLKSNSANIKNPGNGLTARVRLNPGSFTMASLDNVGYHPSNTPGTFTVVFSNVTYVGGTSDFTFDLSYYEKSGTTETPSPYALTQVSVHVGEAVDSSIKPEIILKNSSYGGNTVTAGAVFTLNTAAYNTSPNLSIENVIATVKLPDSITMGSGVSSVMVGNVGPSGDINASFNLEAKSNAEAGTATVTIDYTYYATVQGKHEQFTSSQVVSIPITQAERFEVGEVTVPVVIMMGEEANVSLNFANKGKGIIYNLSASIEGNMENPEQSQYLNNLAAGTENSVDFYVNAKEVGTMTGNVILTYEDASGNVKTITKPFSITVEEAYYPEPAFPVEPEMPEQSGGMLKWIIGGVVVLAAVGGLFLYKKKKAKKNEEDEDEDF